MGFDASVISGVVKFIEAEFALSKIELGWAVASLALAATFAMMVSGPLSDRLGRKPVLVGSAVLFFVSAVASALAPSFQALVIARMVGGLGVGAALIIAPMYIAEIAPPRLRGRMVSINQLNIVVGISAAFFSNYLVLSLGHSQQPWAIGLNLEAWSWRWMLGLEAVPAVLYFLFLFGVPESPRWLLMQQREPEAGDVLRRFHGTQAAQLEMAEIKTSLTGAPEPAGFRARLAGLLEKRLRLVLTIGLVAAVVQQITGINAVFFYAPMIFEQSGIGTDAAYVQAIWVGLTNLVFTLAAMALIDRIGRRALLGFGLSGMTVCLFVLAYGFASATFTLDETGLQRLPDEISKAKLQPILEITYSDDLSFKQALADHLGESAARAAESELIAAAVQLNPGLILFGILGFVASFAISIGPVMWVLFSELFPNQIRGFAISFVGLVNSATSFGVQLVFPWQLANLGTATTFFLFGGCALLGLVSLMVLLPETKDRSLEELETLLIGPINQRQTVR